MTERQMHSDRLWGAIIGATMILLLALSVRSLMIDADQARRADHMEREMMTEQCVTDAQIRDALRTMSTRPGVPPVSLAPMPAAPVCSPIEGG